MFERQISNLGKAALLLHTIRADTERLDLVLELQRYLVRRITQSERRIDRVNRLTAKLRRSLGRDRLPRADADRVKAQVKRCGEVIEELRYALFAWRCFGDGIAAIYQDKYALKHLYYDANYQVKPDAGFISGKAGFRREWKLLRMGIRMGVPLVLSDATNVIRHGDLCALAGRDPVPIEVKSSKNRNARTARQLAQLQELADFYAKDGAENFRGMPEVRRVEQHHTEVNHFDAANKCIEEALQNGFAMVQPEAGLRYIAFTGEGPDDRLDGAMSSSTLALGVTPSADWLPAFPFTLSLSAGNLVHFLLGHFALVVLIDLAHLKKLYSQQGVHATLMMGDPYAVQLCNDPLDLYKGVVRVSTQSFMRIACEFQSLAWFAQETARSLELYAPREISAEDLEAMRSLSKNPPTEIPKEWYDVRDCF